MYMYCVLRTLFLVLIGDHIPNNKYFYIIKSSTNHWHQNGLKNGEIVGI